MAVDYPSQFRLAIQQGKKREVAQQYITSQPLSGKMYAQRLTDDAPVILDFDLIFNAFDAKMFDAWFQVTADSGNNTVNMPIRTEQGLVTHEVRFIEIPQGREIGTTWRYSCSVQAEKIIRPESVEDLAALAEAGYTELDFLLVDKAVNLEWMEA